MDTERIITTQNEVSPCHYTIAITVPKDEVKSTITDFERRFSHEVKIPGFRVGRTPASLIKKRFFRKIREEVKNELIKVGLETAIRRCDPEPVTFPTFVAGKPVEVKDNDEFNFTVEFDAAPKIDLPEYKGIKLTHAKIVVKEKDINKVIEDLLKERASYQKVDRAAVEDDMLKVSYQTDGIEGKDAPESAQQLLSSEETWILISEPEIIPGIINGLKGAKVGENVSFTVTFPESYREEFLVGKSIDYHFTIHEVHARINPQLDDQFVQLYGAKSVDEFKSSIENKLKVELELEKKKHLQQQIYDFLLENANFFLPPQILEAEKQYTSYSTAEEWIKMGKSVEQIEQEKDKFDAMVEESATKRLKLRYVIGAIAKNEDIEVSDAEVEEHFGLLYNQMLRAQKHHSKKPNKEFLKSNIRWNLLMDRVGGRLLTFANISET